MFADTNPRYRLNSLPASLTSPAVKIIDADTNEEHRGGSWWPCPLLAQSRHWRLKFAAVQLDPEPHFVGRKLLM